MFEKLLEYIGKNFTVRYQHEGFATQIECNDHGVFFTCRGHIKPFSEEAMRTIVRHIDERHKLEILVACAKYPADDGVDNLSKYDTRSFVSEPAEEIALDWAWKNKEGRSK